MKFLKPVKTYRLKVGELLKKKNIKISNKQWLYFQTCHASGILSQSFFVFILQRVLFINDVLSIVTSFEASYFLLK